MVTMMLFQLQLLTMFTALLASSEQYYIIPNNTTTVHYQNGTFFTLEELSSKIRIYESDNITLNFLPGNHSLRLRLTINGITNVSLIGLDYNSRMTIKCFGSGGLDFQHIQNLHIESLEFSGCGHTVGQMKGGAITIRDVEEVLIRGCHFVRNQIIGMNAYGGALYMENIVLASLYDSSFISNFALCGGGAMYATQTSRIVINSSHFEMNNGYAQGVFVIHNGTERDVSNISGAGNSDSYCPKNRQITSLGGAVFVEGGSISSSGNEFINNRANRGGAIFAYNCSTTSTYTNFINNQVDVDGGAIYSYEGSLYSTNTYYTNNVAKIGGGICADRSSIKSMDCQFTNNSARIIGGAIGCQACSIVSVNTIYTDNRANAHGGAISATLGSIVTVDDHYINNGPGQRGGAIFVTNTSLSSTSCHYTHNNANYVGGAMFAFESIVNLTGNRFSHNVAKQTAAAIYQLNGHLEIVGSNFTHNQVDEYGEGIVYASNTVLICSGHFNFLNNIGSLFVFNSRVHIEDVANFTNNTGLSGGAITSVQSTLTFHTGSMVIISGNKATTGGGLALTESALNVFCEILMVKNTASSSGGGIYAYHSLIEFRIEQSTRLAIATIRGNTVSTSGGGIHAIATSIQVSKGFVSFETNTAMMNGGALFLEHNSKIYVNKFNEEYIRDEHQVLLVLKGNLARKGGAIYISDSTSIENLCNSTTNTPKAEQNQNPDLTECFLQTLLLYGFESYSGGDNFVNTYFVNNTATYSGGDIYGGLLDRCTTSRLAEIKTVYQHYSLKLPDNGLACFLATVQFDYLQFHNGDIYDFKEAAIELRNKNRISSDVVRVCFCLDNVINCTYNHSTVFTRKGETFRLSVIAVDQVGVQQMQQ